MAELNCLNSEDALESSLSVNENIDSSLNVDNLHSELGENSQISSVLAIDSLNSEVESENATDSILEVEEQVNSELDLPTVATYKGKETKDIIVEVDNIDRTISASLARIKYNSLYEFPSIGSENLIYIDRSTMTMYLWDNESFKYERLGDDWSDIEEINGGNA